MPRLDAATRNIAIGRLQAGESQSSVARRLNVSQSTISRLATRYNQTGTTHDRPRTGRPRVTTPAQDRYIRVLHLRDRTATGESTAARVPGLRRISGQTRRDGRNRVYRRVYERYAPNCVRQVDRFGGGSVMMWAAISYTDRTDLFHVQGNLTAVGYRDSILLPHLLPAIDVQREIFQQDNARPHTARVTMTFLAANNVPGRPVPRILTQ
ncbi:uncharacterized protein LOC125376897 [Haliotis rufescens]|uniref:uncharacterized protein LOC125376897 n=1 Tax=Haliotis rufescens TaxID=6454 RepID=UPI00201F47D0|nr:uncharacterized protein LOC125376897 [Haliotis rufescens]